MSTLWRSRCLVAAMLAVAGQLARAEEAAVPAPADAGQVPAVEATPAVKPAAEAPAADVAAGDEAKPLAAPVGKGFFADYPIHGFLKSRYVARWTDGAGDQDVYETLSLDVGDGARNKVTAHFLGDVAMDVDGNTDNRGYHPYSSPRDSTGDEIVPRVYSAYVDVHRVGPLSIVRAGRQSIYETPEIAFFDGVKAETRALGGAQVKFGAYAGIPVHLYQGYTTDDLLSGAYAESHLWQGARARADWQHFESHSGSKDYDDTVLALGGWQRLGRHLNLHAKYTRLDDKDRDVLGRVTYANPDWDLRVQASYYQLLLTQRGSVIEADAYYPILKDYVPYREIRWMASKGFGDHVDVDAGMDVRRLVDDKRESAFNHEFDRYFGTFELVDLGKKGSSISVTEEFWNSPEKHRESQGLDAIWPLTAKSRISAGTAHYLYKYDYYTDQERDDVQDYYVKFDYKHSRALRFSVNYDYEDDGSYGAYNELRCEAICSF